MCPWILVESGRPADKTKIRWAHHEDSRDIDCLHMEPLYGVLDMLVLRTLLFGPLHGYAIAAAIRDGSGEEEWPNE